LKRDLALIVKRRLPVLIFKELMATSRKSELLKIYKRLFQHFGPQHWWPAESPFEVIVGAILTQNTAWSNVEKAIINLKKQNLLSCGAILKIPDKDLASLIKPSGYYNQKAKRLKDFCTFFLKEYSGDIEKMFSEEIGVLREKLLSVKGIGPETADSILLYAGNMPVFVVDTYTYRILSRHGLIPDEISYEEIQSLFMDFLDSDAELFKEFHALLVMTGKHFCKKKPKCSGCPLEDYDSN